MDTGGFKLPEKDTKPSRIIQLPCESPTRWYPLVVYPSYPHFKNGVTPLEIPNHWTVLLPKTLRITSLLGPLFLHQLPLTESLLPLLTQLEANIQQLCRLCPRWMFKHGGSTMRKLGRPQVWDLQDPRNGLFHGKSISTWMRTGGTPMT